MGKRPAAPIPWATTLGIATGVAVGLGLGDTGALLLQEAGPAPAIAAWFLSAGLLLFPLAGLAVLVAPLLRFVLPGESSDARHARAVRTAGALVRAAVVLLVVAGVALVLANAIQTPEILAAAVAVVSLASFLLAALVGAAAERALTKGLDARVRWVAPFRKPGGVWAIAACACVVALVAGWVAFPDEAEAIGVGPIVLAILAAAGAVLGARIAPRLRRRPGRWIAAGLVLLGFLPFAVLPRSTTLRASLAFEAMVGPRALDVWTFLLDVDRDGYLSVLGGGDCAPFDPARGPGAVDVPDDGIDQDCDGRDLSSSDAARLGRPVVPVPTRFVKKRPIVLVTADALRPDHLGCYGYRRRVSAALDRFARRALRFEHAYSHGPSTRFSIPTLLTSRYTSQIHQDEHGPLPRPLHRENRMLAEILRDAGYRTVGVPGDRYFVVWRGLRDGFDVFETASARPDEDGLTSSAVADAAIEHLAEAEDDPRPLFLWAHFYDTHSPYRPAPGGPTFGRTQVDRYDAVVAQQDRHVGRLLDAVERHLGPREPLVVFASDHGEAFGEHGRGTHGFDLHEEALSIPFLVSLPGGRRGTSPQLVGLVDVVPTIVELVGARESVAFEGRSFAAHAAGGPPSRDTRVFGELSIGDYNPRHLATIHAGRYHLIVDYTLGASRLYDFRSDPNERSNLDPESAPGARALRRELDDWRRRVVLGGEHSVLSGAVSTRPPSPAFPVTGRLGDVLRVVGWDVEPDRPRRGDQGFLVVLHFEVLRRPRAPLLVLLDLEGETGKHVDADHVAVGGFLGASEWRARSYIRDAVFAYVRRDDPPGTWKVRVGLGESRRRMLPAEGENAEGGWLRLGEIEVR